ncbi:LysR family transcriptional regulator [Rhizobium sp. BK418]|uniref:LysR family transcriptional regulator n=1 Tax=Rhizobium sp. BK418 TaxID=2512120 RepID=UPI001044447D|nr:LysR family transcriptional regulator [Rhizobium sp. BK418]TCS09227.1 DNA-binding transcriptional LysR family regulator [Rhizobium sp. BK418]
MLNETDLSRADLNLLVLFEAVIEEGHVGRAADRLNISPSAVSHGLGRLRRMLNDPLFVRTPKGVVATARAMELAMPVADILARVRSVIATADPFDPARSRRRFTLGAPDGVSAVFLSSLLAGLKKSAPQVEISMRQLLPEQGESAPARAWRGAFADLETRAMDIAVVPADDIPARFHSLTLYEEDFVIAMRAGHPFAREATLDRYIGMHHLVVSLGGDPHGFVDTALEQMGLSRRIALTVPNFMFALAIAGESDMLVAVPRRFAALYASRFGLVTVDAPLPLPRFRLNAVAPRAAMMDAGLSWLFQMLLSACDVARSAGSA